MNPEDLILSEIGWNRTVYNPKYMRYLGKPNSQKEEWWLPGAGEGELVFNGYGVSLGRYTILEKDGEDCFTTM